MDALSNLFLLHLKQFSAATNESDTEIIVSCFSFY